MSFFSQKDIEEHNKEKQRREQEYAVATPAKYLCLNCNKWYDTGYSRDFCSEICEIKYIESMEEYWIDEIRFSNKEKE